MKKLRIAVNTRLLIPNKLEGIGRFSLETLKRLVLMHPEVDFVFYFDRPVPEEFIFAENVVGKHLFPPARRTFLFDWWFNRSVAKQLKKDQADVFLSPDGFASMRSDVKQLLVIHDLNFEHFPELLPEKIASYYQDRFPKFARKATRIATVSNFSKSDIHRCYDIDIDRIDVVYNGVDKIFSPRSSEEIEQIRAEYAMGEAYFIYVGSINPRKNIVRLLQAFEAYKVQGGRAKMILVGAPMWKGGEEAQTLNQMSFAKDVIQLGRMSHEKMSRCLSGALAMTFVPLFEGFGIPAIESFASGVPLICANNTSLPEVVGEAALLVDAENVAQITAAMIRIEMEVDLRSELIEKGLQRALRFSWDESAKSLWEAIEKTMNHA
jgi:glycosyltransferase involved in cell wall biosynthesis